MNNSKSMIQSNSMSERTMIMQKIREFDPRIMGVSNSNEHYSLMLAFLYLRSENLITQDLLDEFDPKHSLVEILNNADSVLTQKIFDGLDLRFVFFNERYLREIISFWCSIDSELLKKNIVTIYDDILELMSYDRGFYGFSPKELTEFINGYIGSTKGLRVFNPFAGVASFIKDGEEPRNILAQEINTRNWAIGQLRLIINKSSVDFRNENSILNWPHQEQFDLIVSSPPFGSKLDKAETRYNCNRVEEFLLEAGLDTLSETGRLVAVLTAGMLYSGGNAGKSLRRRFIEEDVLDTVVSFPGGILRNTGVRLVILVLNKNKKNPGKIKLVEADAYVSKLSSRESVIEVQKLLEASQLSHTSSVRTISNEDVVANDFQLSTGRYFVEDIDGVELKDILVYHKGSRNDLPLSGKQIRIGDLKNSNIDFQLNAEELEEMPLKGKGYKIDISCLLLAEKGKLLKPTFFNFDGQPIFRNPGIFSFCIDESKVDIAYLINELHADYVQRQLGVLSRGEFIPSLRKQDLLEVKVKLPSIEEQRAKVAGLREISDKIKQLEEERNAIARGVVVKGANEFASLKHTLGRPRQNILGWAKNFSKFFEREKDALSVLNDGFKEIFDLGMIEAMTEIRNDIDFISKVLEKGENGLILSDYEKEIISLKGVEDIIKSLSSNEFNFSIKRDLLDSEKKKERGIEVNKVLFKTLFDNILTNANKYGFKAKDKGNQVLIELTEIEGSLIVETKNNGLPFPRNFDRDKFIMKYSTADSTNGTGLGGYDINRILTYFENENWELDLNTKPMYPVIFRFSFPIKSMI